MSKSYPSTSGKCFLHGTLDIEILEAKNLPDMEGWVSKLVDKKDTSDPFVDVKLGKARLVKTSVILNDLNPVWNETYRIEVCHFADHLIFEVRDKDHAYSELMGSVQIDCAVLVSGAPMDGWFDIKKKSGKCKGQLKLKLAYRSAASMAKTYNVDCYFPMRENCKVTLYQVMNAT